MYDVDFIRLEIVLFRFFNQPLTNLLTYYLHIFCKKLMQRLLRPKKHKNNLFYVCLCRSVC